MRTFRVMLVAAVFGVMATTVWTPAGASPPPCAASISTNFVLDGDMTCPQNGLVVTGSGIVVDLGGHTITGGGQNANANGVRINGSNVTVRNGTLRNFRTGVLSAPGTQGNTITGVQVLNNGDGILIQRTANPFVSSNNNRVLNNTAAGNHFTGINIQGHGNLVDGNVVRDSDFNGIGVSGTTSGDPFTVQNNTISNNTVSHSGLQNAGSAFIFIVAANNTTVTGNTVTGNGQNPGIFFGGAVDHASVGAQISANTTTGNLHGIWLAINTSGSVAFSNRSVQNAGDGLHVTTPSATLARNAAYLNGGYGINAVPGVTDGGGNAAGGNAVGQCTPNIACA